jgi:hypothetical protein
MSNKGNTVTKQLQIFENNKKSAISWWWLGSGWKFIRKVKKIFEQPWINDIHVGSYQFYQNFLEETRTMFIRESLVWESIFFFWSLDDKSNGTSLDYIMTVVVPVLWCLSWPFWLTGSMDKMLMKLSCELAGIILYQNTNNPWR